MTTVTELAQPATERVPLHLIEQIEKPSVYSVLQSSTLLNALTQDEMSYLASVSRVVRVGRGDFIWLRGRDVDYFGIAATGFVKMVKSCADGSDVTMELFGPGQMFGVCGTICGIGCPLSAVAVTDMWYLRVPKRAFLEIYNRNNVLKDRMVRRLTLRLQNTHELIAHMSGGRVEERIAAILRMLTGSYGERKNGKLLLRVPLTRQEISEMAGTTVESTIRTMSRWQKDGLISTDHHYITILDEDTICALAER